VTGGNLADRAAAARAADLAAWDDDLRAWGEGVWAAVRAMRLVLGDDWQEGARSFDVVACSDNEGRIILDGLVFFASLERPSGRGLSEPIVRLVLPSGRCSDRVRSLADLGSILARYPSAVDDR
jgi:hypothetical protein